MRHGTPLLMMPSVGKNMDATKAVIKIQCQPTYEHCCGCLASVCLCELPEECLMHSLAGGCAGWPPCMHTNRHLTKQEMQNDVVHEHSCARNLLTKSERAWTRQGMQTYSLVGHLLAWDKACVAGLGMRAASTASRYLIVHHSSCCQPVSHKLKVPESYVTPCVAR